MSEVTKEDIGELHKRIDLVNETMTEVRVSVGEIKTTLNLMPKLPIRPCDFHTSLKTDFDGHLADHKDNKRIWQRPIIGTVVDLVKMAVVAAVTWLCLRKE